MTMIETVELVLCRSDAGDGGWSLHAPGATDGEIADGTARVLFSGDAERLEDDGGDFLGWSRPDATDYAAAAREYLRRTERAAVVI